MTDKHTLICEYFKYQKYYTNKFGPKTIVFTQVGSFFEAYSTDTQGYNLQEISELLNVIVTKKNTNKTNLDEKNPNMLGFPVISLVERLKTLTENGLTVIIIEQTKSLPNIERKITGIYSPGTNIDSCPTTTNYVIMIYIKEELQRNGNTLIATGMSAIDITTGKCFIHEAFSNTGDERLGLDEASRFINDLSPKEILIYSNCKSLTEDQILLHLEVNNIFYKFSNEINPAYNKISYQNEVLKKIYTTHGLISPIEYLELEKFIYATISFIYLLTYINQLNEKILVNIDKPTIYFDDQKLLLGNNALTQLNVFPNAMVDSSKRKKNITCLIDVLDHTSTLLGKRYLRNMLCSPMVNPCDIQKCYDIMEIFITDDYFKNLLQNMNGLCDTERSFRKICLHKISHTEMFMFIQSYEKILCIIKSLKEHKMFNKLIDLFRYKFDQENANKFVAYCQKTYDMDKLKIYDSADEKESFFKLGVHTDIDILQQSIRQNLGNMEDIRIALSKLAGNEKSVQLKKNDRSGYYFSLTQLRAKNIQKKFVNMDTINVGQNIIKTNVFKIVHLTKGKSQITILNDNNNDKTNGGGGDICVFKEEMYKLINTRFEAEITYINQTFEKVFRQTNNFIAELDYYLSNVITATKYGYNKPIIDTSNNDSHINCKQLRHPIIERIIDYEYIPHDIEIGTKTKGMLIYGLNSSGKCLSPNTSVMMSNGQVKCSKDIRLGDQLMGSDSTPRKVLGTTAGKAVMYKITLDNDDSFMCNGEHILCLKNIKDNTYINISVNNFLELREDTIKNYVMYKKSLDFPNIFVNDAYLVGTLIGSHKLEQFDNIYLYNSKNIRKEILRGITVTQIGVSEDISTIFVKHSLSEKIIYLIKSLGYKCVITKSINDMVYIQICYLNNNEYEFKITNCGIGKYNGFELDGDHMFLLGDFTVSHNSSFMKEVGISIIMAQAGMYVPSTNYTYSPYTSLFARITGNDNLFKGQSSFGLEMLELKAILKRSNSRTLVIGDEVCRSTEHISGNSIVAATLIMLSQKNTSFIFATHLHEISELSQIKKIPTIKSFHLSVKYDAKSDNLIFDRQLCEGSGEKIYGIVVAKHIVHDDTFIQLANGIKDELLGKTSEIINTKTSKYNKNVYVNQCIICGTQFQKINGISNLDTHHINYQKDCINGIVKNKIHIQKNSMSNLIVLCKKCHDKIHIGDIAIKKYLETSNGKILEV